MLTWGTYYEPWGKKSFLGKQSGPSYNFIIYI